MSVGTVGNDKKKARKKAAAVRLKRDLARIAAVRLRKLAARKKTLAPRLAKGDTERAQGWDKAAARARPKVPKMTAVEASLRLRVLLGRFRRYTERPLPDVLAGNTEAFPATADEAAALAAGASAAGHKTTAAFLREMRVLRRVIATENHGKGQQA